MSNILKKISKKKLVKSSKEQDILFSNLLLKNKEQEENLFFLVGASDKDIEDIEDNNNIVFSSSDYYYCYKKYLITSEKLKNGSKRYFFNIVDTKPYLKRQKRLRLSFKATKSTKTTNQIVFNILKQKNLYYLKKPFEELLKYIHLMSLKIIMSVIFSKDRLYIRSCLEFYLQKYDIFFKRYVDDSSYRVKKYRLKSSSEAK